MSDSNKPTPDLPLSSRPLPSSFDENDDFYNESGFKKIARRLKEEPLVPIGCLLTVAAFTNAYRAMRRGDHHKVQRMFRARVLAQGFTVLAIVAGGMYYAEDRDKRKELWKLKEQKEAEERRQRWIRELEARDEEEKAIREMMDKKRERASKKDKETGTEGVVIAARAALKEAKAKGETQSANAESPQEGRPNGEEKKSGGGGFWGWFGGSSKA